MFVVSESLQPLLFGNGLECLSHTDNISCYAYDLNILIRPFYSLNGDGVLKMCSFFVGITCCLCIKCSSTAAVKL